MFLLFLRGVNDPNISSTNKSVAESIILPNVTLISCYIITLKNNLHLVGNNFFSKGYLWYKEFKKNVAFCC